MIAVDTNTLVYAHRAELAKHEAAKARLVEVAEGAAAWAIPIFCVGEVLRVITNPRMFDPPHTVAEACAVIMRLLESPSLTLLSPGDAYPELLQQAMQEANAIGNLVFDAQVVATCREYGVASLLTEDRDFDRFAGFVTSRL